MMNSSIKQSNIIDKALELAQQSSWETFSLHQLAISLDCSMVDIRHHCRSKEELADALFDRADEAMLKITSQQDFQALSSDQRLLECIMSWFESMLAYKSIVRQILAYKLEPGHFHLQAHGITRISRTVQWFREAARREQTGLNRIADEIAITGIYLATFAFFLIDQSEQHSNTRALLKQLIKKMNQASHFVRQWSHHGHSSKVNSDNYKSVSE